MLKTVYAKLRALSYIRRQGAKVCYFHHVFALLRVAATGHNSALPPSLIHSLAVTQPGGGATGNTIRLLVRCAVWKQPNNGSEAGKEVGWGEGKGEARGGLRGDGKGRTVLGVLVVEVRVVLLDDVVVWARFVQDPVHLLLISPLRKQASKQSRGGDGVNAAVAIVAVVSSAIHVSSVLANSDNFTICCSIKCTFQCSQWFD